MKEIFIFLLRMFSLIMVIIVPIVLSIKIGDKIGDKKDEL